jgi:hypothetical protein
MFKPKTQMTVASIVMGVTCMLAPPIAEAAVPVRVSGMISGVVSDPSGIPQMGATVMLFNRQERLYEKALTNGRGEFRFAGLFPDLYSIRVTLTAFVPALKKGILVHPGLSSVLNVSLSGLFSTIQVSYPAIENGNFMTDDWKWVLRSASSTRPVMRFGPSIQPVPARTEKSAMVSGTRGLFKVSAGEGALVTSAGNEADLGTAFALATSLYGNNLQVAGNVGYGSATGVPTAAFRTSYSREIAGGSPEVSLTMRQLFLPVRLNAAMAGNDSALPMLRSLAASLDDFTRIDGNLTLQYGFTLESVSYLDRLNHFSPYARLTYQLPGAGQIEAAYTSGNARPDLAGQTDQDLDLQRNLKSLGTFPRISLRGARARMQRGEEFEIAYSHKAGSRTYSMSAHHEKVTDAALTMVAPAGLYVQGDLLPDLFSANSIFNAGGYSSFGYTLSATQDIGEYLSASLIYGSLGALGVERRELVSTNPDELRGMIHAGRKHAATARVTATAPHAGTHMIASYQWTADHRWAMPGNVYSTLNVRPQAGLNVFLRQPIPRFGSLPWRMEATADLRNMLAEGYLPINMPNGQSILLVETPRSIRGGLSFIF